MVCQPVWRIGIWFMPCDAVVGGKESIVIFDVFDGRIQLTRDSLGLYSDGVGAAEGLS